MKEKDGIKPEISIREILQNKLNDSRQVGFITYCITAGKTVPPEIKTKFKNGSGGELRQNDIEEELKDGYARIGVDQLDSRFKTTNLSIQSVLSLYLQLLESNSEEMQTARKPCKAYSKALIQKFPELKKDNLFDQHWPDAFVFITSGVDKAYLQYSITSLRATIFGFSQAAKHFGDEATGKDAFDLQNRFKDPIRVDPLEIAGLVKPRS